MFHYSTTFDVISLFFIYFEMFKLKLHAHLEKYKSKNNKQKSTRLILFPVSEEEIHPGNKTCDDVQHLSVAYRLLLVANNVEMYFGSNITFISDSPDIVESMVYEHKENDLLLSCGMCLQLKWPSLSVIGSDRVRWSYVKYLSASTFYMQPRRCRYDTAWL